MALVMVLLLAGAGCSPLRRGPLPPLQERPGTPPPRQRGFPPPPSSAPGDAPWESVDRSLPPRDLVCELARSFQGVPYRYGGTTPDGFDCSGLVCYVYAEAGIELPRTARQQSRAGRRVRRSGLLPGDLVFFRTHGDGVSHVGIYVGRGLFVHAPSTGKTVRTDSLDDPWWSRRFVTGRRVIGERSAGR